jgi:hypothetical protein
MDRKGAKRPASIEIKVEKSADGKDIQTLVHYDAGVIENLEPLKTGQDAEKLQAPLESGGLLLAMYHFRRLLTLGEKGFEQSFLHGGYEPFYPMPTDGRKIASLADLRVDTEVLQTEHAAVGSKWYFSQKDQRLLGFELTAVEREDPCEVYFSDYRAKDGRLLPYRIDVRYGNDAFGTLFVKDYKLNAAK